MQLGFLPSTLVLKFSPLDQVDPAFGAEISHRLCVPIEYHDLALQLGDRFVDFGIIHLLHSPYSAHFLAHILHCTFPLQQKTISLSAHS